MSEYIERGAFKRESKQQIIEHMKTQPKAIRAFVMYMLEQFYTALGRFPAADVEPVVRGEWEDVWCDGVSSFRGTCSHCNQTNDIPPPQSAHYCPSCGAKMGAHGKEREQ